MNQLQVETNGMRIEVHPRQREVSLTLVEVFAAPSEIFLQL